MATLALLAAIAAAAVAALLMLPRSHIFSATTAILSRAAKTCLGSPLATACDRRCGWIVRDKHPLVQLFYLSLILCSFAIVSFQIMNRIPFSLLSAFHQFLIPASLVIVLGSFAIASTSDPGKITPLNRAGFAKLFDYDYWIYEPRTCRTCLFERPARSKHCSVCKCCVAKLDHHCIWINNCVGYFNHRWFLLFLFTTTTYCGYVAYLCIQTLRHEYFLRRVSTLRVVIRPGAQPTPITLYYQWIYMCREEPWLIGLGLFAAFCFIIMLFFTGEHFSIALSGTTTSEQFKWQQIEELREQGKLPDVSRAHLDFNREYARLKIRAMAGGPDGEIAAAEIRSRLEAIKRELEGEEVAAESGGEGRSIKMQDGDAGQGSSVHKDRVDGGVGARRRGKGKGKAVQGSERGATGGTRRRRSEQMGNMYDAGWWTNAATAARPAYTGAGE